MRFFSYVQQSRDNRCCFLHTQNMLMNVSKEIYCWNPKIPCGQWWYTVNRLGLALSCNWWWRVYMLYQKQLMIGLPSKIIANSIMYVSHFTGNVWNLNFTGNVWNLFVLFTRRMFITSHFMFSSSYHFVLNWLQISKCHGRSMLRVILEDSSCVVVLIQVSIAATTIVMKGVSLWQQFTEASAAATTGITKFNLCFSVVLDV